MEEELQLVPPQGLEPEPALALPRVQCVSLAPVAFLWAHRQYPWLHSQETCSRQALGHWCLTVVGLALWTTQVQARGDWVLTLPPQASCLPDFQVQKS